MKFKIDKRTILEEAQHADQFDDKGRSLDRKNLGNTETYLARKDEASHLVKGRKLRDNLRPLFTKEANNLDNTLRERTHHSYNKDNMYPGAGNRIKDPLVHMHPSISGHDTHMNTSPEFKALLAAPKGDKKYTNIINTNPRFVTMNKK